MARNATGPRYGVINGDNVGERGVFELIGLYSG